MSGEENSTDTAKTRIQQKIDSYALKRIAPVKARELWSFGLPVSAVPANCPVEKLTEDNFKPLNTSTMNGGDIPFNTTEFDKLSESLKNQYGRILYYIDDEYRTMIHFEYADRSNPYIYRGFVRECLRELKKWSRNFEIQFLNRDSGVVMYKLTHKPTGPILKSNS